jgi:hypothetical protein
MKNTIINNENNIINELIGMNKNYLFPTYEDIIENVMSISEEDQKTSLEQQKHFLTVNEILVDMYKNKKSLQGNESFLYNNNTLVNYRIEIVGSYVNIIDSITNFKYGYFSLGNKKLASDEKTLFLIFNSVQVTSCKYQCKECKYCYANKYPNNTIRNISSRNKNLILSTYANFEDIFKEVIELINTMYSNKEIIIRIHESGDMYNIEYFKKIQYVLTSNKYKNKSLVYTKNIDILPYVNNDYDYFTVRYSIMNSTSIENIELAKKYINYFYICLDDITQYEEKKQIICNMNCTKCKKCYSKNINTLIVKKH